MSEINDPLMEILRANMKQMLPKMDNNGLIMSYNFGKAVMNDVIEEMNKRGMRWVE